MPETPKCPGRLEVIVEHRYGGWSSDCETEMAVECPAPRCWWPGWTEEARADRKAWTVDQLVALQADHDSNATVGMPAMEEVPRG